MLLDLKKLAVLLSKEPVLTYKMQYQIFHHPLGKEAILWFHERAAMMLDHSLYMYGDEDVLDGFLAQLEPGQEYYFFGVQVKLLPLLAHHFYEIKRDEDCTAYTITPEDFAAHQPEILPLDSLRAADAEFVNTHWTYRHEGSLDFFKHIIAHYPSSAVRSSGKLVGWAVCYDAIPDMANLGSLRVLESHRNQGLGRKLAADLVQKVLNLGKVPLAHILDNNIPSKTLSMGIGFKPYPEQIFWGSGVKK